MYLGNAERPFEGYKLYKIFHKKEGRWYAQLVKTKQDRFTTSYSRYVMSVKLGRRLEKFEQVDHINEDKSDDRIDNLQILTNQKNSEKHVIESGKSAKTTTLICKACGVDFEILDRELRKALKKDRLPACSKKCAGLYRAKVVKIKP